MKQGEEVRGKLRTPHNNNGWMIYICLYQVQHQKDQGQYQNGIWRNYYDQSTKIRRTRYKDMKKEGAHRWTYQVNDKETPSTKQRTTTTMLYNYYDSIQKK